MKEYVYILFWIILSIGVLIIVWNGIKIEIGKDWDGEFYMRFELLPFKRFF